MKIINFLRNSLVFINLQKIQCVFVNYHFHKKKKQVDVLYICKKNLETLWNMVVEATRRLRRKLQVSHPRKYYLDMFLNKSHL